jgi:hypothetical protein
VSTGTLLGAAFGAIGAAAAGQNVLQGMAGGAIAGGVMAAAVYAVSQIPPADSPVVASSGETGQPYVYERELDIGKAIDEIAGTKYGASEAGAKLVARLNALYEAGRIITTPDILSANSPWAVGIYDPNFDVIVIRTLSVTQDELAGTLGHEGVHAVAKPGTSGFAQERLAYDVSDVINRELGRPFTPVSDDFIRWRYGFK